MAKFPNNISQYVIRFGDKYFSVKNNTVDWISSINDANRYASPYAAKIHMRTVLTNAPKDVWYEKVS